jgi:hypothetical protein
MRSLLAGIAGVPPAHVREYLKGLAVRDCSSLLIQLECCGFSFRAKALIADKDVRGPSRWRPFPLGSIANVGPTRSLRLPALIGALTRSLRTRCPRSQEALTRYNSQDATAHPTRRLCDTLFSSGRNPVRHHAPLPDSAPPSHTDEPVGPALSSPRPSGTSTGKQSAVDLNPNK